MGIGEKGPLQTGIANGNSASHVYFPHRVWRQVVEKFMSVEVVILGIQVQILDVKQKACPTLTADQVEKIGIR